MQVLVVLLMEGISALLAEGYSPTRTLMFAFGHDEELRGTKGAGGGYINTHTYHPATTS